MTTCLHNIISSTNHEKFATQSGTRMHNMLARVKISATDEAGDRNIIAHIKTCPGAAEYFIPTARTEVPIAGTIGGRFISRRIDRMYIDNNTKTIHILDYKTDTDKATLRSKYITQLREYTTLLHAVYPDFKITAAILWTHDWQLEKILK